MAEKSEANWYRLKSGTPYHAVGKPPAGSRPMTEAEVNQLLNPPEGDVAEGPEVASGELGAEGDEVVDGPAADPVGPGVDDEVDATEGT